MDKMTATQVKQNFGAALERARRGPLAIERHGKVIALLARPEAIADRREQTRVARERQAGVERERLVNHQKVAIELLSISVAAARARVAGALRVVDRWERDRLCSRHYIDRWRRLLRMPVNGLARKMCEDLDGWGVALRQNSPWTSG
jgi:hypothetical protein